MMNWFAVCIFAFVTLCPDAYGYLGDDMIETIKFCCNEGHQFARQHDNCDGPFPVSSEVREAFSSMCSVGQQECCKNYLRKKIDCESGIDASISTHSCTSSKNTSKVCCHDCARGASLGSSKGPAACQKQPKGTSAEEILANDALVKCCEKAAQNWKETSSQRNSNTITLSTLPSTCEEYAPNELCAHHCIPIPGSYKCQCNPGFMLMADGRNCMEVTRNRCKPHNHCQHKCNDNGVEVKCSCKRGYELMPDGKSCQDIDECQLESSVCPAGAKCLNYPGSYRCIPVKKTDHNDREQCPSGYTWNNVNNACDDINECLLPNPPCPNYSCENTVGGYRCARSSSHVNNDDHHVDDDRCPSGFKVGVNEECEDIDECETRTHDCNLLSQFCINKHGSFFCQDKSSRRCPPGFKNDIVTNKCEDINECEEDDNLCRSDQVCVNQLGQYNCKAKSKSQLSECPTGMRKKYGNPFCEDIDECAEGIHMCDRNQQCLNTNGSYDCHCKPGYELDILTEVCVDVNECATGQHNCTRQQQRCDNTVGSFVCIRMVPCGTGYVLQHSTGKCEDIDECALGTHNCGADYSCYNMKGTFRCRRRTTTTTTTAVPEYEYYYDFEEDNETSSNESPKETTTTTSTKKPETSTDKPIVEVPPNPSSDRTSEKEAPHNNVEPGVTYSEPNNPESSERTSHEFVIPPPPPIPPRPTPRQLQPEPPKPTEPQVIPTELPPFIPEVRPTAAIPVDVRPTDERPIDVRPTDERPIDERPIDARPTDVRPTESSPPLFVTPPRIPPEIPEDELPQDPEPVPTTPYIAPEPNNELTPAETERIPETTYTPRVTSTERPSSTPPVEDNNSAAPDDEDKSFWNSVNPDCIPGFAPDEYGGCFDIDECATSTHTCSGLTEICNNTPGGYTCNCAPGFRRDLITKSCDISTTSSTTSTTTPPPTTPPPPSYPYENSIWGYSPRALCDVGYHYNVQTMICEDINECTNGQATCADVEICINTQGGYRCDCPPNWRLDNFRHRCVPNSYSDRLIPPGYGNVPVYPPVEPRYDVASPGNKYLDPNIVQIEDRGTVIRCPTGYTVGEDNTCIDVNECETGEAKCGPLQTCTNLPGGYTCSCPNGHRLIADHECEDINECANEGNVPTCSQNADCVNTIGSYRCQCHNGFRSAPVNDKVCVDVDECTASRTGSLCQHRCNNVWGGYRCSCHRGYRLNYDNSTCSDIDECTEFKSKIICVGRCLNEPGSYRCTCPAGYRLAGDNKSCVDIDECETGEALCSDDSTSSTSNHVCVNTRGSYKCHRISCPVGYRLENKHRCTKVEKICQLNDWGCTHQPTTISYNFITFVSNLYIPDGQLKLFTMKGPAWSNAKMNFKLLLVNVNAPPSVRKKADINDFLLTQTNNFEGLMSLIRPLEGPQSIELEMTMEVYTDEQFGGTAVAKLLIFVSEYEF